MINESLVDEYSCYNFPSTGTGSKYLDHGKISDSKGNSRCKNIDCAVIQKHLEITNFKHNRIDELLDVIDEMEGKVIIWANYVHDIEQITEALEKEYGEGCVVQYYGKVSSEDRQTAIKEFQDPKSKVKYFIGNTQTGGYGITLTAASNVIYYSNSYDLEKRLQSEDRAHRIGQHKPVTYVDLIAEKTVDDKIIKALRKKINIASTVMGDTVQDWI